MIISSSFRMGQYIDDDHQKKTPLFKVRVADLFSKTVIGLDLTVENIQKCVGNDQVHELMVHPGYVAKQDQGGFDGPDDFALSSDRFYEFNFLMNQTDFEIL